MKKKALTVVLAGIMIFSLIGCGDSFKEGIEKGYEDATKEEKNDSDNNEEASLEIDIDEINLRENII